MPAAAPAFDQLQRHLHTTRLLGSISSTHYYDQNTVMLGAGAQSRGNAVWQQAGPPTTSPPSPRPCRSCRCRNSPGSGTGASRSCWAWCRPAMPKAACRTSTGPRLSGWGHTVHGTYAEASVRALSADVADLLSPEAMCRLLGGNLLRVGYLRVSASSGEQLSALDSRRDHCRAG